jgi:hypothetical protein
MTLGEDANAAGNDQAMRMRMGMVCGENRSGVSTTIKLEIEVINPFRRPHVSECVYFLLKL